MLDTFYPQEDQSTGIALRSTEQPLAISLERKVIPVHRNKTSKQKKPHNLIYGVDSGGTIYHLTWNLDLMMIFKSGIKE